MNVNCTDNAIAPGRTCSSLSSLAQHGDLDRISLTDQKRDCLAGSIELVIARNVAISQFHRKQTDKRKVSS